MQEAEIWTLLERILVEEFKLDPASISPTSDFYDDLGLDSLDMISAALVIEDECGCKLEEDELRSLRTPGAVVECLVDKLAPRA